MRLSGMLDDTQEPTKEELDALRQELLTEAADPNSPRWEVGDVLAGTEAERFMDMDFGSDPNTLSASEEKEGVVSKLRRFFFSIFN